MGLVVVLVRVGFRVLFGDGGGGLGDVAVSLPGLTLPWAGGLTLLGDITWQALLAGLYDGMRLATLIICIGAANSLADPKRLLASVPNALHDLGTVLVVAVSVFPQLAESVLRVRRARRLRGGPHRGRHAVRGIIVPVLTDALDRSLVLAGAMESRGYGRHGREGTPAARRATLGLSLAGVGLVAVGAYGTLDLTAPRLLAMPAVLVGLLLCLGALWLGGRSVRTTRYRRDPFGPVAVVVALCGAATALLVARDAELAHPSLVPLEMPRLGAWQLLALLAASAPAWCTPPTPLPHEARPPARAEVVEEGVR